MILSLGANDFLSKPFDRNEILEVLKTYLNLDVEYKTLRN